MAHRHLSPKVSSDQAIEHFKSVVGPSNVLLKPEDLKAWGADWTKVFEPKPLCIVLPGTTEDVARILSYCNTNQLAVTPSLQV